MQLLPAAADQAAALAAGEALAAGLERPCPARWTPGPGRPVWALVKEGTAIGGARGLWLPGELRLEGLFLLPGWQRRGYGRFCLRALGRAAAGRALTAADPGAAAGFFGRMGFSPGPDGAWRRQPPVSGGVVWAQRALADALAGKPAPVCLDATCGNGHDTVFLARLAGPAGRVLALDIQPAAVEATRARLAAAGFRDPARHRVVRADHARLARVAAAEGFVPLDGAMFNFGWLPGADHAVQSRAGTSRAALAAALALLAPGGALTAVLYSPGQGPQEEEKRAALALFAALDPARFAVTAHPVPPGAPLPVLARKRPL